MSAYEVWADAGLRRELEDLPVPDQDVARGALAGLAAHPRDHPQTVRLKGSDYPGSFRLRVGRLRLRGLALDRPRVILLTTVFVKKRESDYEQALQRHEARLKAQGPPLGDFVKSSKRRR